MTVLAFIHAVVVAAAVLGLWLFVRLRAHFPESLKMAFAHVLLACAGLQVMVLVLARAVGESPSTTASVAALLAIFLPAMTYVFVAAAYLLDRLQQRLLAR